MLIEERNNTNSRQSTTNNVTWLETESEDRPLIHWLQYRVDELRRSVHFCIFIDENRTPYYLLKPIVDILQVKLPAPADLISHIKIFTWDMLAPDECTGDYDTSNIGYAAASMATRLRKSDQFISAHQLPAVLRTTPRTAGLVNETEYRKLVSWLATINIMPLAKTYIELGGLIVSTGAHTHQTCGQEPWYYSQDIYSGIQQMRRRASSTDNDDESHLMHDGSVLELLDPSNYGPWQQLRFNIHLISPAGPRAIFINRRGVLTLLSFLAPSVAYRAIAENELRRHTQRQQNLMRRSAFSGGRVVLSTNGLGEQDWLVFYGLDSKKSLQQLPQVWAEAIFCEPHATTC